METAVVNNNENYILSNLGLCAGLLRISTEKTDSSGKKVNLEKTLQNHKEKMNAFLDEKKLNADLYEEVVSGGANIEDRHELKRLIDNIDKYEAIFCIELTRLSRQGLSSQIIKEECKKRGILIITLNPFKIYNMQNPQDSFMFDMSISMGEYERMLTSLRVKQNKISMARQGLNSSGSVPLGYVRNKQTKKLEIEMVTKIDETGKIVIDEKTGKAVMIESPTVNVIRQIYKWFLEGAGKRTIADNLNSMGIKNKNGNQWIPQSIRVVLECKTYKGTLVAKNYEDIKGKRVVTEKVEIDDNHPAIIPVEMWEAVQKFRKVKRERSGVDQRSKDYTQKKHVSILDNLVYCSCCNRKSTIKYYSDKKRHYIIKCSNFSAVGLVCTNGGIALKDIEHAVFEKLLTYKAEIENRMNQFKSNDFTDSIKELEEQKELLEKQQAHLLRKLKIIRSDEQDYKMQKEEGIIDLELEAEIATDKKMNQKERLIVQEKLTALNEKLQATPAPEKEIAHLAEKRNIIEELQNSENKTVAEMNNLLQQIILKVHYKRELPDNYRSLASSKKNEFPAEIEIEYVE